MGCLTAIVLGAAAGGGIPQWNCRCDVCRLAWEGDPRVKPRTQASLAISADGEHWALLNASPDLRAQIQANPSLHPPCGDKRGSPITAVVLTGGEIDQIAGLLSLRERSPFTLHATAATLAAVADNPMFGALAPDIVKRHAIVPGKRFSPVLGIEAELFIVPGKVPLYLESDDPDTASESSANVGVEINCGTARIAYVPGAATITPAVKQRLASADIVMFDGTVLTDDEMIRAGTGSKTGRRMGHMPLDGAEGSLAALADLRARRIFVHINNTNPILIEGSPERMRVEAAGWEVAEDGLKVVL
jgi:pyrroloquinoline quinone biosynthesis protein B